MGAGRTNSGNQGRASDHDIEEADTPEAALPPAELLADEEVRGLLAACPDSHAGVGKRAQLALHYRDGLRLEGALNCCADLAEWVI